MTRAPPRGGSGASRVDGAEAGGRTGTAQRGVDDSRKPYAWSTSYAKDAGSGAEVAVAVFVEDSDATRAEVGGNGLAAPFARRTTAAAPE